MGMHVLAPCDIHTTNPARFDTVVTVRSQEKGQRILDAHPNTPKEKLSFVVVEDVAAEGAFDEVSRTISAQWQLLMTAGCQIKPAL